VRVLFLAHRVPWPPDKGDRLRSDAILRWLCARHEVHLGALADTSSAEEARATEEQLAGICASVRIVPRPSAWRGFRAVASGRSISEEAFRSTELEAFIRSASERVPLDAALGYSSQMARPLFTLPAPRRVIDLVDVDSRKWQRRFAHSHNPVYWLEARRVRALELACLKQLDAVTVVSRREAAALGGESGRVRVMRMGVDLRRFPMRRDDTGGARLAFVGAMDYPPNAEGVLWFAREVLPQVRQRHPEATLVVVGRHPPKALHVLPGVEVLGWVDDVRLILEKCVSAVVPIHTSHGVQTKAVVTMALGVPQVLTHATLEGLEAEAGSHALVASDASAFADAVVCLLQRGDVRRRIAANARQFAETNFDWERNLAVLDDLLSVPTNGAGETSVSGTYPLT